MANGLEVAKECTNEGNGGGGIHFTDGTSRVVAARIPLLLAGGTSGKYPLDLEIADIFETGCVVLKEPKEIDADDIAYIENRREVEMVITGGFSGHRIQVPRDLVIALHPEKYPISSESAFGSFVLNQTLRMHEGARHNLPKLGQLAIDF